MGILTRQLRLQQCEAAETAPSVLAFSEATAKGYRMKVFSALGQPGETAWWDY